MIMNFLKILQTADIYDLTGHWPLLCLFLFDRLLVHCKLTEGKIIAFGTNVIFQFVFSDADSCHLC